MSTATVSRSLRNDGSINPATRARVLEAASRLGYRARTATRGARRSGPDVEAVQTIGVLIGHPAGFRGDPSSAGQSMLAGISDAANIHDLCLSVHFVSSEDALRLDDPEHWPPALRSGLACGLILLYPFPHAVVEQLAAHWPCVAVSPPDSNLPADFVDVDEVNAIADLVDHLHQLGHTRIGFLTLGQGFPWEAQ
ncbi:MAG: LacI family DNA-binding transcriptional regulator, partial [Planctomycetes bacterium]|nr:LacI family DNA-binding transcriptional regulator [Planctomycetota bacterium]